MTPICGKYLHVAAGGARTFLLTGGFICAVGNISFGFLDRVGDSTAFLALSFVTRIVTAIGEGAIAASAYSLAARLADKENEGKVMAAAEFCFGVGTMFGPSLGGFLYQVGGFSAPFFVAGGVFVVVNIAAIFLLEKAGENGGSQQEVFRCLTIP